ncbi:MAG TPA: hypothetical protein VG960_07705 [Caulobacteraceae bacterium]|nr:hypothetical protein [Caulobacteraceae bacterium]
MKLLRMGLIAAVMMAFAGHAMAADAPKIDPAMRAQGMKEAPAVAQAAGVNCTVSDALFVGSGTAKVNGKDIDSKVYEVACKEGLGYFFISPKDSPPEMFDCLSLKSIADQAAKGGKGGGIGQTCKLPDNQDPKHGLEPLLVKANVPSCTVANAKYIGSSLSEKISIFEASCTNGHGYLITAPLAGSTHALSANDCAESALFAMKCEFTSDAAIKQQLLALPGSSNPAGCQPSDARWVVTSVSGDRYYEIACSDGKSGYIFQADIAGKVKQVIPCANAEQLAGGCTLTNISVARTEQAGLYSTLATKMGYPCTVTKYQSLNLEADKPHREVVELACKEHPGSVWTLIPTEGGDPVEMNCIRATSVGLPSCKLTPMSDSYLDLASQIKSKGKTCAVSNARYLTGVRDQNGDDFVEVACSGGGGMVIAYTPASIEKVLDVFDCKETAGTTRACKLK